MKTSELTGSQLDLWTAKAQGWPAYLSEDSGRCMAIIPPLKGYVHYSPSGAWLDAGKLIDDFEVWISNDAQDCDNQWIATTKETHVCINDDLAGYGPDPKTAICRSVIASVYGDEVTEDDE